MKILKAKTFFLGYFNWYFKLVIVNRRKLLPLMIYKSLKYRFFLYKETANAINRIKSNKKNNVAYLFGVPTHSNIGDQAQSFCISNWIHKNYPSYKVELFNYRQDSFKILKVLRNYIKEQDKIFIHSGYHLTDIYNVQDGYCRIIEIFHDKKIVIFPQTINYLSEQKLSQTAKCLNSHPALTILCRDEISFKTAKQKFTNCRLLLYPDIVTSLIGTKAFSSERNGILFCIRNDKEKFYSSEQITAFSNRFEDIENVYFSDTSLNIPVINSNNREKIITSTIEEYSKYKLIITDRYHGTIFSLIAGTPVIVISSTDHKLTSGVRWFPLEFKEYISYANNLEEAFQKSLDSLNKERNHVLPPFFKENYYDILKHTLEQ